MKRWLHLLVPLLALLLAACATPVTRVDSGTHLVGARMQFDIDGAWNHLDFVAAKPAQTWTMEGVFVDQLLVYADVKDGDLMHPRGSDRERNYVFHSAMNGSELVSLFEGVYTRDGSVFKLLRSEPSTFAGKPGVRFEFELIRKADNVQLHGLGFAVIDRGQLYALVYQAPRLAFYPREAARVEALASRVTLLD